MPLQQVWNGFFLAFNYKAEGKIVAADLRGRIITPPRTIVTAAEPILRFGLQLLVRSLTFGKKLVADNHQLAKYNPVHPQPADAKMVKLRMRPRRRHRLTRV